MLKTASLIFLHQSLCMYIFHEIRRAVYDTTTTNKHANYPVCPNYRY